jgi:hypothetical protein
MNCPLRGICNNQGKSERERQQISRKSRPSIWRQLSLQQTSVLSVALLSFLLLFESTDAGAELWTLVCGSGRSPDQSILDLKHLETALTPTNKCPQCPALPFSVAVESIHSTRPLKHLETALTPTNKCLSFSVAV